MRAAEGGHVTSEPATQRVTRQDCVGGSTTIEVNTRFMDLSPAVPNQFLRDQCAIRLTPQPAIARNASVLPFAILAANPIKHPAPGT